ncbi:MAG: hypothetical protein WAN76_21000 [Candidatus Sulfotelmatobacter sp.]
MSACRSWASRTAVVLGTSTGNSAWAIVEDTITPAMQASKVPHEIARGQAGDFSKNRWLVIVFTSSPMSRWIVDNCD